MTKLGGSISFRAARFSTADDTHPLNILFEMYLCADHCITYHLPTHACRMCVFPHSFFASCRFLESTTLSFLQHQYSWSVCETTKRFRSFSGTSLCVCFHKCGSFAWSRWFRIRRPIGKYEFISTTQQLRTKQDHVASSDLVLLSAVCCLLLAFLTYSTHTH